VGAAPNLLAAIRGHHERFDGMGYPDGLRGKASSLAARIVAVADCFDAMTSTRPYRRGLPRAEALERLRQTGGTQLDPWLVEVFLYAFGKTDGHDSATATEAFARG
jgi:HD-GYP domain-containing protein (c-di-GMP phosphodiesterase class II)